MALQPQTIQYSLAGGLNQKSDPRALAAPDLAACLDAQFDQLGGLQPRPPAAPVGVNVLGGGTLTNFRRIFDNSGELICFTDVGLYSWSVRDSAWVPKGAHLAIATSEKSVFSTNSDQLNCDRAELNGTIVYSWIDLPGTGSNGPDGNLWVAAMDKASGAVIMPPFSITALLGVLSVYSRPRLVALQSRILLFGSGVLGTNVWAIDPANVLAGVSVASPATISNGTAGTAYIDVDRIPGTDSALFVGPHTVSGASDYQLATVTAGLGITTVIGVGGATSCGPISLAIAPDASLAILSALPAPVGAGVPFGNLETYVITLPSMAMAFSHFFSATSFTNISQVASGMHSTKVSGQWRAEIWVSSGTDPTITGTWADGSGAVGGLAQVQFWLDIASRGFDHNGSVYFWTSFAQSSAASSGPTGGPLQNTYFLLRSDGVLFAKATYEQANGGQANGALVRYGGWLPGVALTDTNTYSWCGAWRRILDTQQVLGPATYDARAPRDIVFTFDSNDARRSARIGATRYIAGGQVLQYDSIQLVELGFHVYPWEMTLAGGSAGSGAQAAGAYSYKSIWRWDNAAAERDRSTTATEGSITVAAAQGVNLTLSNLPVTLKPLPTIEVYRTDVNPVPAAPLYLVSSNDPNVATNPNRYLSSNPRSNGSTAPNFLDGINTADVFQLFPEAGAELENLAPPASRIIVAAADRVFLAGIANAPNDVWYSKQRQAGQVVSFSDELVVTLPVSAGAVTAIGFLNETTIVFCEQATFALEGAGFDNALGGSDFVVHAIPGRVGCVAQESVTQTPSGLMFKAVGGWYIVDQQLNIQYIGAPVTAYDSEDVQAVLCMEDRNQVRILSSERLLIWDYYVNKWAEWTIAGGLGACIWQGQYVYLTAAGPMIEKTFATATPTYGIAFETGWIKLADLQGFGRVWDVMLNGEYRGAHTVLIQIARNYQYTSPGNPAWFDAKTWTPTPTVVGSVEQVKHSPSIQQCESIKVRATVLAADGVSPCATEGVAWTGIAFACGFKPGLFKLLPAAQTQ